MEHLTSWIDRLVVFLILCTFFAGAKADDQEAYQWETALTLESISNVDGGNKTGTRNLANLDISLTIDTQAADWWSNGTVFAYVLGTYGKPPSELTGEFQTLSNIEAYDNLTFYELWYQHRFLNGAVKLLAGLHDYNSTFYSLESAGLFTLSSFGIGPEVAQVSPSIFPTTAASVHLSLSHNDQYFFLAAYDGIPGDPDHARGTHVLLKKSDGILTAAEWGFAQERNYKFGVGGWETTAEVESAVDGSLLDSNRGYYLIGEKYFSENLAVFFQYGQADSQKNQLNVYSGAGITYSELWVKDDSLGIGYAQAKNGSAFILANPEVLSAENIIEVTYSRPLMESLHVQTSLYYVENPSMNPLVDNSAALGVRLYIDF